MLTDASQHRARAGVPADREAEASPRLFWQALSPLGSALAAGMAPVAEAVQVYVNHGRWVAECPDCHGAQLASRTDRRFLCNYCANVAIGGLWRPTVWPTTKLLQGIEETLSTRPDRVANWVPGETLATLRAENGVG